MARLRRDGARYHHKRLARGEWLRSAYIITTGANSLCALIHDRMPVILDPADSARWVGEEEDSMKELKAPLRSFNPERMETSRSARRWVASRTTTRAVARVAA